MTKEIAQELGKLNQRISRIQQQMDELTRYLNERQQGDIDFIAMETGVDLDNADVEPEFEEEVE